jgi:general secretion pathway protein K
MLARNSGAVPRTERGVALVLVLWIALALTLIGSVMSSSLQREARATGDILAAAQARQAARAGVSHGLAHLRNLDAAEVRRLTLAGTAGEWQHFTLGDLHVRYRFFGELGRLDLNRGDRDLIQGLLLAVGVDGAQADMLTDNLLDWRDRSPETRLHGTSPEAYAAIGLPEGRRDGDFESVEELQQVAGFTPEIYRRLAPHLTVHTGARRPAPEYASAQVLAAHRGADLDFAEAWIRDRRAVTLEGAGTVPPFPGGGARGGITSVYGVEAVAGDGRGARAHVEAVFDLRAGERLPITVLEWREPPIWPPAPGSS